MNDLSYVDVGVRGTGGYYWDNSGHIPGHMRKRKIHLPLVPDTC